MRSIMYGLAVAFAVAFCVESARADLILSISPSTGANSLAGNSTGQTIDLFGYSNTGALNNVLGIDFGVQILGAGGVFEGPAAPPSPGGGITFTGISSIWDAAGFTAIPSGSLSGVNGAVGLTDDDFANFTSISGNSLSPSFLGRFNIDTTGISGTSATLDIVAGGFVLTDGGSSIPITPLAAPYQVAAVPEPSSLALVGFLGMGLVGYRRRRLAIA